MNTRRLVPVLAVSAVIALMSSCSGSDDDLSAGVEVSETHQARGVSGEHAALAQAPQSPVAAGGGSGGRVAAGAAFGAAVDADRKIVRSASLTVRVDDPAASAADAARLAEKVGGRVAEQSVAGDRHATLVLQVPPKQLPAVLEGLDGLGKLLSQRIEAADVTAQSVDLDARLASARASAERLRTLLAGAEKVDDLVRIESELAQRESTVESLSAQQRELASRVELARIDLDLVEAAVAEPDDDIPGFFTGLRRGWVAAVDAGSWTLAVLGFALPFVIPAAALVLAALWIRTRRRRRREPAAAVDEG